MTAEGYKTFINGSVMASFMEKVGLGCNDKIGLHSQALGV